MTEAAVSGPKIRLARPDFDEQEVEAVRAVLQSGILTNGPRTVEFERRFAERHDTDHGVAFANGTVALAAMYLALGIGPGDEVILPSLTFISSATSLLHVGATPVFAEIDPDTFNLDPGDVAARITARTRAILVVHYAGQPADMDELSALASESNLLLLEDAAEAHGSSYRGKPVGSFGKAAMFSFTGTKNISMGEGGIVTTSDGDLASRLRLLRNHGQTALYKHEVLGYNWRLTEMQAAMGVIQVQKLDGILARKRANAMWMTDRLGRTAGVNPPVARPDRDHTYMLYTVTVDGQRDAALDVMNDAGIESRLYFPPAHRQPVFDRTDRRLPVTEEVSRRMLSIPFHSRLTASELHEIADTLEGAVAGRPVAQAAQPSRLPPPPVGR